MNLNPRQTAVLLILLTSTFLFPGSGMGAAAPPFVLRTAIVPDSDIWVGQRVLYRIDVLGKNGWAKIQRMPDLQISGAVLVPFENQGVRLNETIDGETYTGQRYEHSLFPRRSGSISVPPVPVNIEIRQWGGQAENRIARGALPPVRFSAEIPPGAEEIQGLISTIGLTAEQRWEPDVTQVSVGDAVRRTILLEAENVSAMAFTPISFAGSALVDVYPQSPTVEDRYDRGTLTGRRTETVSYVFIKAGSIELPAVTLTWWDIQNKKLREAVLPERAIEIAPSAAARGSHLSVPIDFHRRAWVFAGFSVIALITCAAFFHNRLQRLWIAWKLKREASERAFFRRFVKAARTGHPADALNTLMRWLDRLHTGSQSARLDRFLTHYSDLKGVEEADLLLQAMDSNSREPWQGRHLIEAIRRARRKWIAKQRKSKKALLRLPELNPTKTKI